MKIPTSSLSIRYHSLGKPNEVLTLETVELPELSDNDVLIRLIASTVNPSDLGMIQGSYGRLKDLPAVGGREGVGEIVACGASVSDFAVGDWVRMPEGAWQQFVISKAAGLFAVPNALPPEQAGMAFVNPATAVRLLKDFGDLKAGDWVIQNAANSAVGFCVAGYARSLGLKTLNVVRDMSWESDLKAAGADVVISENDDYFKEIETLTGGARPKLGLNSVGGESVNKLIKSMGTGGTVVTFGGMVGDKIRFPTRFLIFNDIRLVGYWMDKWGREQTPETIRAFMDEVFSLIEKGVLRCPVDSEYSIENGVEAVSRASEGSRRGKVVIRG